MDRKKTAWAWSGGVLTAKAAMVVGAGLGGLASAIALQQRGWEVSVVEQSGELAPVGAGIALGPNALRALDVIGVGRAVRSMAAWQGAGGYRTPDGSWLLRMDLQRVWERLGDAIVILRRAELIDLLVDRLAPAQLRLGLHATEVSPGGRAKATLITNQGTLTADLVVAADGLNSGLRARCFPSWPGPRYAGYTAWRLLPRVESMVAADCQFETWGPGERFSALQMRHGEVYAWATATAPAGERAGDERAELLRRFGSWHDPIPALIESAPATTVLRHDVYALPRVVPAFHRGRVAFVGDAAHAMTPDLGQGGCTALEDAVVLAHTVGETQSAEIEGVLAAYTAQRRPRTATIHRRSQQLGRIGQVHQPLHVALRSAALRASALLPERALLQSLEPIAGWSPP